MSAVVLTGPRASVMARCPRACVYGALGTPEDPAPFAIEEYYRRGLVFERLRLAEYEKEYGSGDLERQREIPWLGGTAVGHADGYVRSRRLIVEVVSSVSPSQDMISMKMEQAIQYVHFDEEAEHAVVDVIDPSRLVPVESIPCRVTAAKAAEIDERVASVVEGIESGGEHLPDRVCAKPSDARGRLCSFALTCFAGWETPARTLDTREAADAFRHVKNAKEGLDVAKGAASVADGAYRLALEHADEYLDDGDNHCAGVLIKRTPVKARRTFKLTVAEKSGAIDPGVLDPFVNVSEPSVRYTVAADEETAASDVDYGEHPFDD